ncbi:DNA-binding protein [Stenotrophomonas rhizophila]|uniref:DNA-binding protein n=1 Tax=Stenotrophomonas TaxID=40323 RepID=UPI003B7662D8
MARNLKTVKQVSDLTPFTEAQLRYWLHMRMSNGMAACGVPVHVGRRVYIDMEALERWIDSQQSRGVAA